MQKHILYNIQNLIGPIAVGTDNEARARRGATCGSALRDVVFVRAFEICEYCISVHVWTVNRIWLTVISDVGESMSKISSL